MDSGRKRYPFRWAALLAVGLAACGGGTEVDNTPASIVVSPSTAQSIASGNSVTLSAEVRNKGGAPLTSAAVTWSTSNSTVAAIDQSGKVTGSKVGTATITAAVSTLSSSPVSVTVTPGTATQLALRTQPASAISTAPLTTQPVIEVRDAAGNLVTSSSLAITAALATGSATLSGTASANADAGVAAFTDLTLTGSGAATLTFSGSGVASVTSTSISIAPGPSIALAASTATLAAVTGGPSATTTIAITNGGGATLRGLAVTAPSYMNGQPTGWLTASLNANTAPATLTLTASPTGLAAGTYSASVSITATNAGNSPQTVAITFAVTTPPSAVTYGAADGKVFLLAPGASATPPTTVLDGSGNPLSGAVASYSSRSPGIATVDATGKISAVAEGATWVVASIGSLADSVWLNVTKASGPVLSTTLSRTTWNVGDIIEVTVVLDTRGATVGGATLLATWSANTDIGTPVSFLDAPSIGVSGAQVLGFSDASRGIIRLTVESATGLSGRYELATFRLRAVTAGVADLYVFPQDLVAVDQSSLTAQTTSTHYPLIVK
jgi:Bacterial Ig-like domain (group 2)